MKILDCESVDSTYASLEEITEINHKEIKKYLANFDMNKYCESHPWEYGDKILLNLFKKKYNCGCKFDYTCWFHLTRTFKDNKFERGILPLGEIINEIWDLLFELLPKEFSKIEWIKFRENLERCMDDDSAESYRLKINDQIHWGPFAMLVRGIAFKAPDVGNHDYLAVPEIIEDICECFKNFHEYDLLGKYKSETRPCIIKFKTADSLPDYLGSALYYLYCIAHNVAFSLHCNTCFDAMNNRIDNINIQKIDYV